MMMHAGADSAGMAAPAQLSCSACAKPRPACVCDRLVPHRVRREVVVLQHPQEKDALLGTVPLLRGCLPAARLRTGLSWASLAAAAGPGATAARWAVLYPASLPAGHAPLTVASGLQGAHGSLHLLSPRGAAVPAATLDGIIVLDGSWSQAKALWWRNPWLLRLVRAVLVPDEPSMYGRLRREPQRHCVSSLEALAGTLAALGEPAAAPLAMRRGMRTLLQRLRAADRITPPAPP